MKIWWNEQNGKTLVLKGNEYSKIVYSLTRVTLKKRQLSNFCWMVYSMNPRRQTIQDMTVLESKMSLVIMDKNQKFIYRETCP